MFGGGRADARLFVPLAQVPTVVEQARAALGEGHAVVIGLQATGEAAAQALDLRPGQVRIFHRASSTQ